MRPVDAGLGPSTGHSLRTPYRAEGGQEEEEGCASRPRVLGRGVFLLKTHRPRAHGWQTDDPK